MPPRDELALIFDLDVEHDVHRPPLVLIGAPVTVLCVGSQRMQQRIKPRAITPRSQKKGGNGLRWLPPI